MRLSDVMSGLGLGIYPIVAMGLFAAVFFGVLIRVVRGHSGAEMEAASRLPLGDGAAGVTAGEGRNGLEANS